LRLALVERGFASWIGNSDDSRVRPRRNQVLTCIRSTRGRACCSFDGRRRSERRAKLKETR
jgi:hypothetical protein